MDDQTATREWLLTIGGLEEDHPMKVRFARDNALDIGLWNVGDGWKAMLYHTEHASSCIVRGLTTRQHVLDFLKVTGVLK